MRSAFITKLSLIFSICWINSIAQSETEISEEENEVFTIVEEMPFFPGGESKMIKFLQTNIIYPDSAYSKNIQGTVFVSFIVEKNGTLSNVRVLRSANKFLDLEALRVIKIMPDWIPGKQNGKAVRVQYNLPIKFNLK